MWRSNARLLFIDTIDEIEINDDPGTVAENEELTVNDPSKEDLDQDSKMSGTQYA